MGIELVVFLSLPPCPIRYALPVLLLEPWASSSCNCTVMLALLNYCLLFLWLAGNPSDELRREWRNGQSHVSVLRGRHSHAEGPQRYDMQIRYGGWLELTDESSVYVLTQGRQECGHVLRCRFPGSNSQNESVPVIKPEESVKIYTQNPLKTHRHAPPSQNRKPNFPRKFFTVRPCSIVSASRRMLLWCKKQIVRHQLNKIHSVMSEITVRTWYESGCHRDQRKGQISCWGRFRGGWEGWGSYGPALWFPLPPQWPFLHQTTKRRQGFWCESRLAVGYIQNSRWGCKYGSFLCWTLMETLIREKFFKGRTRKISFPEKGRV